MNKVIIAVTAAVCLFGSASAGDSTAIRMNQVGFFTRMPKVAVVVNGSGTADEFYIINQATSDTVYTGVCTPAIKWVYSDEMVSLASFGPVSIPGRYLLVVPGVGASKPFVVDSHPFGTLAKAAMKSYYYQRASIPLEAKYAGKWARAEGHPDTAVVIHASAAGPVRKTGDRISAPRGWYDAGDYNKYIVNSGITTYTILAAYEDYPDYCRTMELNIPETGNGIPDILNEALWNVRWMLSMQDPADGGVYAKLTNANFEGFIMPAESLTPRYVVMKTAGSSLDFAAVMAQTSRIMRKFDSVLPGFADTCLQASLRAWKWARENPKAIYNPRKINAAGPPEIRTGNYGDNILSDEFAWAAAELTATTRADSFLAVANPLLIPGESVPGWPHVRTLALYTLARFRDELSGSVDTDRVISEIKAIADTLLRSMDTSAYAVPMGYRPVDFNWGSNANAANQAMVLSIAYRLTGDRRYLNADLANIDYLLGRNATTYSFVTGFGSRTPMHIHHRISGADGIDEPVPGFLVGGPNPNKQDRATTYPSYLPARGYSDDLEAYASNEICINWNAPLVYILVAMEAAQ